MVRDDIQPFAHHARARTPPLADLDDTPARALIAVMLTREKMLVPLVAVMLREPFNNITRRLVCGLEPRRDERFPVLEFRDELAVILLATDKLVARRPRAVGQHLNIVTRRSVLVVIGNDGIPQRWIESSVGV